MVQNFQSYLRYLSPGMRLALYDERTHTNACTNELSEKCCVLILVLILTSSIAIYNKYAPINPSRCCDPPPGAAFVLYQGTTHEDELVAGNDITKVRESEKLRRGR